MTDANEKKLLLAPESYRYWAVNPTILFNYDSLIIDKQDVYHIGASLKDLGKKWFAFSRLDKEGVNIMGKIK